MKDDDVIGVRRVIVFAKRDGSRHDKKYVAATIMGSAVRGVADRAISAQNLSTAGLCRGTLFTDSAHTTN